MGKMLCVLMLVVVGCEAKPVEVDMGPDLPQTPPAPPPIQYEMKVQIIKREGRKLTFEVLTNLPKGQRVQMTAWRAHRRPDPEPEDFTNKPRRRWDKKWYEPDERGAMVKGEVCATTELTISGEPLTWTCEPDDRLWLDREKEPMAWIDKADIGIRAEWSFGRTGTTYDAWGPSASLMVGPCIGHRDKRVVCADEMTYPVPYDPSQPSGVADR